MNPNPHYSSALALAVALVSLGSVGCSGEETEGASESDFTDGGGTGLLERFDECLDSQAPAKSDAAIDCTTEIVSEAAAVVTSLLADSAEGKMLGKRLGGLDEAWANLCGQIEARRGVLGEAGSPCVVSANRAIVTLVVTTADVGENSGLAQNEKAAPEQNYPQCFTNKAGASAQSKCVVAEAAQTLRDSLYQLDFASAQYEELEAKMQGLSERGAELCDTLALASASPPADAAANCRAVLALQTLSLTE